MTQHFNLKVFKLHPKISLGDQDNHHFDKTISVPFEHMRLCYLAATSHVSYLPKVIYRVIT